MRYYLDTEFDGFHGGLLTLALVREDGESIYLHRDIEPMDLWVRQNVIPFILTCPIEPVKSTNTELLARVVAHFLHGDPDPVIVSDWPADIRYLCELIELPHGQMVAIPGLKFEMVRVDAYPTTLPGAVQHNAWWDAMALRHKLMGEA
jgi:hypothetical protein